jgi:hypothetical protein
MCSILIKYWVYIKNNFLNMFALINNIIYLQRKPKYKLLQSSKRT